MLLTSFLLCFFGGAIFIKTKCSHFKGPFIFDLFKLYKPPFHRDGWWIVGVRLILTAVGFLIIWPINPVLLFLIKKLLLGYSLNEIFVPPPHPLQTTEQKLQNAEKNYPNLLRRANWKVGVSSWLKSKFSR